MFNQINNAKDYMIQRYIDGEIVSEEEWLLYYEHLMEEAERTKDEVES